MAADTTLNNMSGGDKIRTIDLGAEKIQAVLPFDPALIQTQRFVYSGVQTNQQQVAGIGGQRLVVRRYKPKSDPACPNIAILVGFGTPVPAGLGCVYSHPNLPPGIEPAGDGAAVLGVGGDGQGLFITTGAITGGNLEINMTFEFLPTAGI